MFGGRKYEIFLEMQQHNGLLFTKSNIQGGPYGSITTVFLTKLGGGFVYNTRISGWLVGRSCSVKKTLGTPLTASQLLYCFINQIYERCPATAVKKLRVIVFVVTSVLFHIVWCPTKTKTKTLVPTSR